MNLLDIQSWWEIPSIAHFCSLFRTTFDLPQFDIDDLEIALLNDVAESSEANSCVSTVPPNLIADLVFRLVTGSKAKSYRNRITLSNCQIVLRDLLRQRCEQLRTTNPFSEDTPFEELPLHTKVRIIQLLCDIRLDAEDVPSIFAKLEAESLRVDPLGKDAKGATYWYFCGTRLYRDDAPIKVRSSLGPDHKKSQTFDTVCRWHLVCQTPDDWEQLVAKLKQSSNREEIDLHSTLTDGFLPKIGSLFAQQEQLKRKKLIQASLYANIRRSSRVVKPQLKHEELSNSRSQTASPQSELSGSVTPIDRHSENDGADSENEDDLELDENRRYPGRRHRQPRKRFTL